MSFKKTLGTLKLFQGLTREELVAIENKSKYVYLKKNDVLFYEGDPAKFLYVILYGSFKIFKKGHQDEIVIFNFLGKNEVLGISVARVDKALFTFSAMANEESCVLQISTAVFRNTFLQHPLLESRIQEQLLQRFLNFQDDRCMSRSFVAQKIADLLLRMSANQPISYRSQIMIPLTRHDIARRIGSETETVVRLLSQWTKNGWIQTKSKHIEILDREALENIKAQVS